MYQLLGPTGFYHYDQLFSTVPLPIRILSHLLLLCLVHKVSFIINMILVTYLGWAARQPLPALPICLPMTVSCLPVAANSQSVHLILFSLLVQAFLLCTKIIRIIYTCSKKISLFTCICTGNIWGINTWSYNNKYMWFSIADRWFTLSCEIFTLLMISIQCF